jgi:hypothetical protein
MASELKFKENYRSNSLDYLLAYDYNFLIPQTGLILSGLLRFEIFNLNAFHDSLYGTFIS